MKYGFTEVVSGSLPYWNPHQAAEVSFLADPTVGFFYPLYWPFLYFSDDTAIDIDLVMHLAIASTSMALLCRHFAMHWGASILAGIVYAYQGSMVNNFECPSTLAFVVWTPLIFLLIARVFDSPTVRSMIPLALAVGVSILGGSVQHAYFNLMGNFFVVFQSGQEENLEPQKLCNDGRKLLNRVASPCTKTMTRGRGVVIPSEHHRVVFTYDPTQFRIAGGLSLLALLVLLGLGVRALKGSA